MIIIILYRDHVHCHTNNIIIDVMNIINDIVFIILTAINQLIFDFWI